MLFVSVLIPFYFFLAIDCGPLDAPSNGSSSGDLTVYPNGVRFSCDPGFLLVGSSKRVCMANGTWSGFETSCKRKLLELKNEIETFSLTFFVTNHFKLLRTDVLIF